MLTKRVQGFTHKVGTLSQRHTALERSAPMTRIIELFETHKTATIALMAAVMLGAFISIGFNSVSAESPWAGISSNSDSECINTYITRLDQACVPDVNNDGEADKSEIDAWKQANYGEYACMRLRSDFETLGGPKLTPFVYSQIPLRLEPVNDTACWGYNDRDELVIARSYHASGNIAAHWESSGDDSANLFRQWHDEGWYDATFVAQDPPSLSIWQEGTAWQWIFPSIFNDHMDATWISREFVECSDGSHRGASNEQDCRYNLTAYNFPADKEPVAGFTVYTYTSDGFLYGMALYSGEGPHQTEKGRVASFFADSSGEMTRADYFARGQSLCPPPLTIYDRRGDEVRSSGDWCSTDENPSKDSRIEQN